LHTAQRAISLASAVDARIPYLPMLAPLFVFSYTLCLMPILFFPEIHFFRRGALALVVMLTICFACYAALPVRIFLADLPRETNGFWLRLPVFESSGWNSFPSLHIAAATLALMSLVRVKRFVTYYALALWVLAFVGSLFLKRHYFYDNVVGLILGAAAHFAFVESTLRRYGYKWRF
ncbi:MAG: phosphatase PAP2 family protein, partial [Spirochaetes bacterium]|nr:phosphatase PAP2 family protein [Spirochaetota bacterium]